MIRWSPALQRGPLVMKGAGRHCIQTLRDCCLGIDLAILRANLRHLSAASSSDLLLRSLPGWWAAAGVLRGMRRATRCSDIRRPRRCCRRRRNCVVHESSRRHGIYSDDKELWILDESTPVEEWGLSLIGRELPLVVHDCRHCKSMAIVDRKNTARLDYVSTLDYTDFTSGPLLRGVRESAFEIESPTAWPNTWGVILMLRSTMNHWNTALYRLRASSAANEMRLVWTLGVFLSRRKMSAAINIHTFTTCTWCCITHVISRGPPTLSL